MKAGRVYNKAMIAWLTENYPKMMISELTAEFNRVFKKSKTPAQIKSCLTNNGIKAGVKRTRTVPKYSEKHLAWLAEHYLYMKIDELTDEFNKRFKGFGATKATIHSTVKRYQIKSGRTGQFKKGETSWNKGKKGLNTGGEAGWFKKGTIPANHKFVGSERVNKDGYIEVKIAEPNLWDLKPRITYREHHGEIPNGKVVIFKDNNKLNCEPENLMLISRAQLVVMNKFGVGKAPEGLKQSAVLFADLVMKLRSVSAA